MKSTLLLLSSIFFTITTCFSQKHSGTYVITLKNDAIDCIMVRYMGARMVCDVEGRRIKYKAKEILGYHGGGYDFDSGRGKIDGWGIMRWRFFTRSVSGNLNLYIVQKQTVNRMAGQSNMFDYSLKYFVRRANDKRGDFTRLGFMWQEDLKAVVTDCPEFTKKVSKEKKENLDKLIEFYNSNCGKSN